MGSEQSSRREREYREERSREPAATPRDVEKALEKQRKVFEQKVDDLIKKDKGTGTVTRQQHVLLVARAKEPAATPKDVEIALEKQRKVFEQKIDDLIKKGNGTGTVPKQQPVLPVGTANLERQRTPYALTLNGLQNRASSSSTAQNLYPHLDSGYSTLSPSSSASPGISGYGYVRPQNSPQNTLPQLQRPLSQPNQCFQPSAPPIDTAPKNPRSRSRQRGQDADINCPTCDQLYGERIFQCNQGHSSCERCRTRLVPCGQCRQQITNRRNFDLEKYVSERRIKCPNSTDGCCLFIKLSELETHAKECPFKALQCPSLESFCTWNGKLSQLADHFDWIHPTHRQADVDKEMLLSDITNTSHTMHYIQIGPFNFLFHLKVSKMDKMIYIAVQLIGTKHSASKWDYEIHVYNKSQPRRKYQHVERCTSTSESIHENFENMKCAVLPVEYAKTFICGGVLAYKFYIKREDATEKVKTDFVKENVNTKREFVKNYRGRGPRRHYSKNKGGNQQ